MSKKTKTITGEKIDLGREELKPVQKLIKLDWYFHTPFEKILLIIFLLAFIYSVIRIIAQGFW